MFTDDNENVSWTVDVTENKTCTGGRRRSFRFYRLKRFGGRRLYYRTVLGASLYGGVCSNPIAATSCCVPPSPVQVVSYCYFSTVAGTLWVREYLYV